METGAPQTSFPTPNIYQTNELQLWITTYLHACRSRNLSEGTIEFHNKKLGAFIVFCLENDVEKIGEIHADLIRHFLIVLAEKGHRPAGIHCYYRAVKTFLKWYEREAEPENWRNPINKVKSPIVPVGSMQPAT